MKRTLMLAGLLACSLASCRGTPITLSVGTNGVFEARLSINDEVFVVAGKDGRLLIEGEDRGPIKEGDRVTVDWNHDVRVNGVKR